MSISPHAPGYPQQRPPGPSTSFADWVEAVEVGLAVFTAVAIVAVILALLIII